LPKIAEKSPKIAENCRKSPKIAENRQKMPKNGKYCRKSAKIAKNSDHYISFNSPVNKGLDAFVAEALDVERHHPLRQRQEPLARLKVAQGVRP
jgi:hypothetical protein